MSNLTIDHNAFDTIQFSELINSSNLLKRYLIEGTHHLEYFESLLEDIFHIHFKHAIFLNHQTQKTINYEIISSMLKLNQLTRLRKRTVGSLSNTYLTFKLVLDGLFESLRGRPLIEDIKASLDILKDMDSLKSNMDSLKDTPLTIDIEKIFSRHEQTLLKKYLEEINGKNSTHFTENDWFNTLFNEIFEGYKNTEDTRLNNPIRKAIDDSIPENESTSTEVLLNKLLEQSNDEISHEVTELQTEIEKTDKETSDDFKEALKDELEEKFAPYLKEQYLSKGQQQNNQKRFVSELDDSDTSRKNIVQSGKANTSKQVTHQTIHKISSDQEKHLRQMKNYAPSSRDDPSNPLNKPYSDEDYKHIQNRLKRQIDKLNLPDILSQAIKSVDEFNNTTRTLGIKENSLNNLTFDEVINMHKRYITPSFVKFVNKVGKNKFYASQLQYKKKKEHNIATDKIYSSHNIDLLIEDEYIGLALGIEAFENDFYDRYLRDDLLTNQMIQKYDKRKGPIVLCYDGSGSMEGVKIKETQSHILAIIEIAKIQKRHLILIQFASASEPLYIKEINPSNLSAQDVFDVLDEFICGGTDFEKPLSKAIEYIKSNQHKKSDILFITDGQCEIRDAFKKSFLQLKQERDFKLYTIIMHAYTYRDFGDIGDISDHVLEIKGRDIGNWNDATNKKLYSLI
jgi:uncharacterized protein with von Willebrand factor type A (vWA) domain